MLYLCLLGALRGRDGNESALNAMTGVEFILVLTVYRCWWVWDVPLGIAHMRRRRVCSSMGLMAIATATMIGKFSFKLSLGDAGK